MLKLTKKSFFKTFISFNSTKNYLGKEVGLFVLLCFFNCGLIFVLLFWRLIILSWSCKQKFVSHFSDSEMPDYNPKWVKKVSPPPPGTTLTRANSKQILQAVDPGFIQLQELRQDHQPKQEMAVPGRSKTQGLNSHKDRAQSHRNSPPKGSGNIQTHFTEMSSNSHVGNGRLKIINILKFSCGKMRWRDCILTFLIKKKIVTSYFFSFSCMKFFWLCTWAQEWTELNKKHRH